MSVSTTAPALYRGFQGYANRALPAGHWFLGTSVLGDASGGARTITVEYQPATGPVNSRWYSLEELYLLDTDNNDKACQAFSSNGTPVMSRTVGGLVSFECEILAGGSTATINPTTLMAVRQGIFIGRQNGSGTAFTFGVSTTNVNGATLAAQFGGYWWDTRSNLAPGGPTRPPQGLW